MHHAHEKPFVLLGLYPNKVHVYMGKIYKTLRKKEGWVGKSAQSADKTAVSSFPIQYTGAKLLEPVVTLLSHTHTLFLRNGAKYCKGTVFNKHCIQHTLMLHISKFFLTFWLPF